MDSASMSRARDAGDEQPLLGKRFWQSLIVIVAAALILLVSAPSPVAAAGDCTVAPGDQAIDSEEQAMLNAINAYRQQNGRQPLTFSGSLTRAASWMSKDMADKNYFNHTDSLGRAVVTRMADCGYAFNTARGENLAAGYADAASTLNQWKNSPGHNTNLLRAEFTVAGIARHYNPGSTYRWYWTLDLGGHNDGGGVTAATTGLFRLWNWDWMDHFYTANAAERDYWSQHGWAYQGECCQIFPTQAPGTTALYRLWSYDWGDHLYTIDAAERDRLIGWGWVYEGITGYCYPPGGQPSGSRPLYRLWSWGYLDHMYTADTAERDRLVSWGWQYQRIECYVQ